MRRENPLLALVFVLASAAIFSIPSAVSAHCDTMDGPVVAAARHALETGDVKPVLIWVRDKDEAEISDAFKKTLAVRKLSPEARELADMHFFGTLVRVHRAGEGAPYTGLKPAGTMEPAVAEADKALDNGSVDHLAKELSATVEAGVRERFNRVLDNRKRAAQSVPDGRAYVASYIEYVHYVERLHNDAAGHAAAHHPPEKPAENGEHHH